MYGPFRSLYYVLIVASILLIVWLLVVGCAAPDMGRQEATDIVKLERLVR